MSDEKNSEETCVGLTDGKHCSRDCFSYLVCNNGSKTVVHCNQSQIYNPVLKACDIPTSTNKGRQIMKTAKTSNCKISLKNFTF